MHLDIMLNQHFLQESCRKKSLEIACLLKISIVYSFVHLYFMWMTLILESLLVLGGRLYVMSYMFMFVMICTVDLELPGK